MRQAILAMAGVAGALILCDLVWGYGPTYSIAYGAITLMALMIAGTFAWLWRRRATPLALGMAFSWTGTATVMGWWWIYTIAGYPDLMTENRLLFAFCAFYITGAALHFSVIQRSVDVPSVGWIVPVAAAVALSAVIVLML